MKAHVQCLTMEARISAQKLLGVGGRSGTIKVAKIMDPLHKHQEIALWLCFIECLRSFVYSISSGDSFSSRKRFFFCRYLLAHKNSLPGKDHDDAFTSKAHILLLLLWGKRRDYDSLINNKTRVQQQRATCNRKQARWTMFFLSCSKFLQGKYCLLIYHLLLGHEYISKAIYIYIYIYI